MKSSPDGMGSKVSSDNIAYSKLLNLNNGLCILATAWERHLKFFADNLHQKSTCDPFAIASDLVLNVFSRNFRRYLPTYSCCSYSKFRSCFLKLQYFYAVFRQNAL